MGTLFGRPCIEQRCYWGPETPGDTEAVTDAQCPQRKSSREERTSPWESGMWLSELSLQFRKSLPVRKQALIPRGHTFDAPEPLLFAPNRPLAGSVAGGGQVHRSALRHARGQPGSADGTGRRVMSAPPRCFGLEESVNSRSQELLRSWSVGGVPRIRFVPVWSLPGGRSQQAESDRTQ